MTFKRDSYATLHIRSVSFDQITIILIIPVAYCTMRFILNFSERYTAHWISFVFYT